VGGEYIYTARTIQQRGVEVLPVAPALPCPALACLPCSGLLALLIVGQLGIVGAIVQVLLKKQEGRPINRAHYLTTSPRY